MAAMIFVWAYSRFSCLYFSCRSLWLRELLEQDGAAMNLEILVQPNISEDWDVGPRLGL